jgi:hypothetical protein
MTSGDAAPERWLPVVGYEEWYEVSDRGRVRSLDPVARGRHKPGMILSPFLTVGYPSVTLWPRQRDGNGKPIKRTSLIHDLMLTAFVGPRPPGMECCHEDDVKTNNVLGNLSWGTSLDNKADMRRNGGHGNTKKVTCKRGHRLVVPNLKPRKNPEERECLSCSRAHRAVARCRRIGATPLPLADYADSFYRVLMGAYARGTGGDSSVGDA